MGRMVEIVSNTFFVAANVLYLIAGLFVISAGDGDSIYARTLSNELVSVATTISDDENTRVTINLIKDDVEIEQLPDNVLKVKVGEMDTPIVTKYYGGEVEITVEDGFLYVES